MRRAQRAPAARVHHLNFRADYRRHGDQTQFVVLVLWIAGFSAGVIAAQVGLRRSQVLGVVNRSPFAKRSTMSDRERQSELDTLRAVRSEDGGPPLDGGVLANFDWKIQPISDRRKMRPARRVS